MKTELIVWNGNDGYILLEDAKSDPDFSEKIENNTLYTQKEAFEAFEVAEIKEGDLPRDEDGELELENVYIIGNKYFSELNNN